MSLALDLALLLRPGPARSRKDQNSPIRSQGGQGSLRGRRLEDLVDLKIDFDEPTEVGSQAECSLIRDDDACPFAYA